MFKKQQTGVSNSNKNTALKLENLTSSKPVVGVSTSFSRFPTTVIKVGPMKGSIRERNMQKMAQAVTQASAEEDYMNASPN